MSAEIIQFRQPTLEEIEIVWATHRALCRAEMDRPELKRERGHRLAKEKSEREFLRVFDDWVKSWD